MTLLQFCLLVFGLAYVCIAPLWVTIECDVHTPLRSDSTPPLLNLLVLVTIWLPLFLLVFPVAILLRLLIPARNVNTEWPHAGTRRR